MQVSVQTSEEALEKERQEGQRRGREATKTESEEHLCLLNHRGKQEECGAGHVLHF